MRCIGRNKNFKRCKNEAGFLFCGTHKYQWLLAILIIIPTYLATYGGLYRDIIEPMFSKENKLVKNEYELKQLNIVTNLEQELIDLKFGLTILVEDDNNVCEVNIKNDKCGSDYNIFSSLFNIKSLNNQLLSNDFEWRPYCLSGEITENEIAKKRNDSIVNIVKYNILENYKCVFPVNGNIYLEDNVSIQALTKYLNSTFLPSEIKKKIKKISDYKISPTTHKKVSEGNDYWYLLADLSRKNNEPILKQDLIYKISINNKKVNMQDFLLSLVEIQFSVHNWLNEKGIKK